jgi:hypothetical protein
MERPFVFLLLAPLSVALIAALFVMQAGEPGGEFVPLLAGLIGMALFCFTLPVSTLTGYIDDALSNVPVLLRASLSGAIGAVVAYGLAFVLFSWASPPPHFLMSFGIGGAACTGISSLLANDYSQYDLAIPGYDVWRRFIEKIFWLTLLGPIQDF